MGKCRPEFSNSYLCGRELGRYEWGKASTMYCFQGHHYLECKCKWCSHDLFNGEDLGVGFFFFFLLVFLYFLLYIYAYITCPPPFFSMNTLIWLILILAFPTAVVTGVAYQEADFEITVGPWWNKTRTQLSLSHKGIKLNMLEFTKENQLSHARDDIVVT